MKIPIHMLSIYQRLSEFPLFVRGKNKCRPRALDHPELQVLPAVAPAGIVDLSQSHLATCTPGHRVKQESLARACRGEVSVAQNCQHCPRSKHPLH